MHYIRGRLAAIAICIAALASAQTQPQTSKDFLKKYLGFTDADIVQLDKGELITKLPRVTDQREVAAFAAVRVNARPEQLAAQFRDIVRWKKGDSVPEIGKFNDIPLIADLAGLNIEPEDIKSLKKCKPGSCGIKLSANSMDRLVGSIQDKRKPRSRPLRRSETDAEAAGRLQRPAEGIQLRYRIRTGTCELHRQISERPTGGIR